MFAGSVGDFDVSLRSIFVHVPFVVFFLVVRAGVGDDWPECPCCVATAQGLDPSTEDCKAIRTPTLTPIVTPSSDSPLPGVTATPMLVSGTPCPAPTEATSAPRPAPSVAPVVPSMPTATVLDTPAPTAAPLTDDEICTEACISIVQESDYLGAVSYTHLTLPTILLV